MPYTIKHLQEIPEARGNCGFRRPLLEAEEFDAATFTWLRVDNAREHYHQRITEFYYVLEGEGALKIDGQEVAVAPGTLVRIEPGTRHQALGSFRALLVATPAFTKDDMYFD